jgi:Carboxypeptidase regulatory-like domain/LysM domain
MWIVIERGTRCARFVESLDQLYSRTSAVVCPEARASALLHQLQSDPISRTRLRRLLWQLDHHLGVEGIEDRDAQLRLDRLLRSGRIRIAELPREASPALKAEEGDLRTSRSAADKAVASISYQVVDNATGDPIEGVTLFVTLPDDKEVRKTTDKEGTVRFDGLKPGRCSVRSEHGKQDLLHVLAFDGFSLHPMTMSEITDEDFWERPTVAKLTRAGKRQAKEKAVAIATVRPYKVKTGDTLESISEANEMTSDDLVRFNFGTTDPKEVQLRLGREVGCKVRDLKSGDYVLSSRDKPGIVYLPEKWSAPGQYTDHDYVIRVHRIEPHQPPFIFSM